MATGETRIGNADYISSGAPTEDPGTGAFDGEYFGVTGNGTGAGVSSSTMPSRSRTATTTKSALLSIIMGSTSSPARTMTCIWRTTALRASSI